MRENLKKLSSFEILGAETIIEVSENILALGTIPIANGIWSLKVKRIDSDIQMTN